ncbi:MAG TPA: flagellar motor switch protein FliN [Novosphingobium sp.]|nr:flagellar motor switch protein FliN [Novosphingobium sp.]
MSDEIETRQLAPAYLPDEVATREGAASSLPPRPAAPPSPDDLQAVFDVPVKVQAVLGRSRMDIGDLLRLKPGMVVELDRRVGEPVDIFVNNRLIARGEVVLIDSTLGITLTEIVRKEG